MLKPSAPKRRAVAAPSPGPAPTMARVVMLRCPLRAVLGRVGAARVAIAAAALIGGSYQAMGAGLPRRNRYGELGGLPGSE